MAVRARIREEREKRGWTQGDLGEHSGTNRDTISGIESGRHRPRPSTLQKLAGAFGLEVRELFEDVPRPKIATPRILSAAEAAQLQRRDLAEYARGLDDRSLESLMLDLNREYGQVYRRLHENKASGHHDPAIYKEFDRLAGAGFIVGLVRQIKTDPVRAPEARKALVEAIAS